MQQGFNGSCIMKYLLFENVDIGLEMASKSPEQFQGHPSHVELKTVLVVKLELDIDVAALH